MAQGLQTFLPDGVTVDVDITDRLPRLLGYVDIPASKTTGQITNPFITPETDIWWFMLNAATNFTANDGEQVTYEYPTITKGNGYLYWNFPAGRKITCRLIYGVY